MPRIVVSSAELNLLTVPFGKPGKYGSRSLAISSSNLCNSLRAAGLRIVQLQRVLRETKKRTSSENAPLSLYVNK